MTLDGTGLKYDYSEKTRHLSFVIKYNKEELYELPSKETAFGIQLDITSTQLSDVFLTNEKLYLKEYIGGQIYLNEVYIEMDYQKETFSTVQLKGTNQSVFISSKEVTLDKQQGDWLVVDKEHIIRNESDMLLATYSVVEKQLEFKDRLEEFYCLMTVGSLFLAKPIELSKGFSIKDVPTNWNTFNNKIQIYFAYRINKTYIIVRTLVSNCDFNFKIPLDWLSQAVITNKSIEIINEDNTSLPVITVDFKVNENELVIASSNLNNLIFQGKDHFHKIKPRVHEATFLFTADQFDRVKKGEYYLLAETDSGVQSVHLNREKEAKIEMPGLSGVLWNKSDGLLFSSESEKSVYDKNCELILETVKLLDIQLIDNKLYLKLDKHLPLESLQLMIKTRYQKQYEFIKLVNQIENDYVFNLNEFINKLTNEEKYYDLKLHFIIKNKRYEISLILDEDNSTQIVGDIETSVNSKARLYITKNRSLSFYSGQTELVESFKIKKTSKNMLIANMTVENNDINLYFSDEVFSKEDELTLCFVPRGDIEEQYISLEVISDNVAKFSKNILWDMPFEVVKRWDVFLKHKGKSFEKNGRLQLDDVVKRKRAFLQSNSQKELDSKEWMFYTTDTNKVSLVADKRVTLFREKHQIMTEISKFKKHKNKFYCDFEIKATDLITLSSVFIKLRSNEKDLRIPLDVLSVSRVKNTLLVSAKFEMDWTRFFPIYWDVFVEVMISEVTEIVRIKGATKDVITQVNKNYLSTSLIKNDQIIYPYVTFGNDISLMVRTKEEYETKKVQAIDFLGYLTYKIMAPYFNKKNIWLGFEKFAKTAQDNGYAFFDYVMSNNLTDDFYYVLDKKSNEYAEVSSKHKNVLPHMSYRYFIYLYAAKRLIASETPRHVHNIRVRSGRANASVTNKQSVFLQHGVTAFKQSDVFKKMPGRGNFDLVIATSDMEKTIIHENWLYDNDEITVTGFSRWDLLEDKSKQQEVKSVFVMPTWRSWMEDMPKEDFVQTDYFLNYTKFLNSLELNQLINEQNMEVVFFLHPKFKEYISEFEVKNSERIKLFSFGEIKVNEYIMKSSVMISDYSSVTWDMFYMNKPVIFFQFDADKYNEYEGSYIDMSTELFGDRAVSVAELNDLLFNLSHNNFEVPQEYRELRQSYFKYTDKNNSQRIFDEMKKLR